MFMGFLNGLMALWPVIKEYLFSNQSAQEWASKNKLSLIWLALIIILFGSLLYTRDAFSDLEQYAVITSRDNTLLKNKVVKLQAENQILAYRAQMAQAQLTRVHQDTRKPPVPKPDLTPVIIPDPVPAPVPVVLPTHPNIKPVKPPKKRNAFDRLRDMHEPED